MRRREGTVSAAKHQAIRRAAAKVFLDKGYAGASMDEVAALAAVGKQTVYKHFADKGRLFADVVMATTDQVDGMVQLIADRIDQTDEPERDLKALARQFLTTLMQPEMLRLRRVIIASVAEFPELGRTWYERGFERVLATLAGAFSSLTDRGLLSTPDPAAAAEHFVGLLLWIPMNKSMFTGEEHPYTEVELQQRADLAVETFLAAYRAPRSSTP